MYENHLYVICIDKEAGMMLYKYQTKWDIVLWGAFLQFSFILLRYDTMIYKFETVLGNALALSLLFPSLPDLTIQFHSLAQGADEDLLTSSKRHGIIFTLIIFRRF